MYEYRKLTPEEQEEVVRIRQERGYPPHAPPHLFCGEGYYMITAANYEHAPIMSLPLRRTNFELAMIQVMQSLQADVKCWAILPNHYHILVRIDFFGKIEHGLKILHGKTSRDWNIQDTTPGRRVWYKYSDRKIRNERHYYAVLNYIHYNSVKHGYVTSPEEWMWSSVHLYMRDFGEEWLKEKWSAYPITGMGNGWDD